MTDQPQPIVIDLAGAMEKITPEMLDQTRDLMIETLMERCATMREALEQIIEICANQLSHTRIQFIAQDALPK